MTLAEFIEEIHRGHTLMLGEQVESMPFGGILSFDHPAIGRSSDFIHFLL